MADVQEYAGVVALAIKAAMAQYQERIALLEAKLAGVVTVGESVTEIRERLVVAETKAAMVQSAPQSQPITIPMGEQSEELADVIERIAALEQRPAPEPVDVSGLRDRLVAIETKAVGFETRMAAPDPLSATVEKVERTVADLAKEVSTLRERVAVAEVRQPVPGPPGPAGKDGKDGVDGLGYDDLVAVQEDDRSLTVKAVRGDHVKAIGTMKVPSQIYRDVWQEGQTYERGDTATWAGSTWHCNETTTSKPGESKAWTLMVKRGRDGKDGKDAVTLPVVKVSG